MSQSLGLLQYAFSFQELEEFCFRFALNHMTAVTQTKAFSDLDPAILKEFIRKAGQAGAFRYWLEAGADAEEAEQWFTYQIRKSRISCMKSMIFTSWKFLYYPPLISYPWVEWKQEKCHMWSVHNSYSTPQPGCSADVIATPQSLCHSLLYSGIKVNGTMGMGVRCTEKNFTLGVLWAQFLLVLYQSFWNFAGVFFMVWGCACGLDIIVRLL